MRRPGPIQVALATTVVLLFFVGAVKSAPSSSSLLSGGVGEASSMNAAGMSNDKENMPIPHGVNRNEENEDKDVEELENLKPFPGSNMVMVKSQSAVVKNINGQKEIQSETKEEVDKNGKLVARVHQQMEEKDDKSAPTPLTRVRTEIEIPERNIHKVFEQGPRMNNDKRKSPYVRAESDENNVEMLRSYAGVQFSPMDMAKFIFWSGDEKEVTMAIEDFLQEGLMSREEAISYLQDIKMNLDYLQSYYADQMQKDTLAREHDYFPVNNNNRDEEKSEQSHQFRKNLSLLEKAKQARNEASELMEVRQQMRENVNKKNVESLESDPIMQSKQRLLQAQGLTDDDYDDLLERLRVADFLYTEYSLEEIIYQLAKVMFSQSLTRGSSEAQEALEKFTRFLETEAEMGRISRSLEKKVLDVLIAGLTDTLTEHPELVSVARESLGVGAGSPVDDQVLQQLLILNRGASDKTDSLKMHSSIAASNSNMNMNSNSNSNNNNRFLLKDLNRSPEGPTVMMKKSVLPNSVPEKLSQHKST